MATHLILRAIRDFCAPTHTSVRVVAGDVLDLSRADVQHFIRSSLRWDAFSVDFIDDAVVVDAAEITALSRAADAALAQGEADHQAALKAYADAQEAVAKHAQTAQRTAEATAAAEIARKPEDIAEENARSAALRRAEIAASESLQAAARARASLANTAGRLTAQLRAATPAGTASATGRPLVGLTLAPGETGTALTPPPRLSDLLAKATVDELVARGIAKGVAAKLIAKAQDEIKAAAPAAT